MKKLITLAILIALVGAVGCDDGGDSGFVSLKVTVTLDPSLNTYPTEEYTLLGVTRAEASGNVGYWEYPLVGGTGEVDADGTQDNQANETIKIETDEDGMGSKHVLVYLVREVDGLTAKSKDLTVVYKGEVAGTTAERVVKIKNIEAGNYYVIAFYDYADGGNQDNRLNRYDRYAIWDGADDVAADVADETSGNAIYDNSIPQVVTVVDDVTKEIAMNINKDYVLGQPSWTDNARKSRGRLFYTQALYDLYGYPQWDDIP